MRRFIVLLLLILALAPGTWLRSPPVRLDDRLTLAMTPLPLPSRAVLARHLGPFALEAVWEMRSPHYRFDGYSALVALRAERFLAINDRGFWLEFTPPGFGPRPIRIGPTGGLLPDGQEMYDSESATYDRASGSLWIGWEGYNAITRQTLAFGRPKAVQPHAMREWGRNSGPEAMVRLADGRFLVLREGSDGWLERENHRGLLFADDPVESTEPRGFTFSGPAGFSPVDMAQLPDGRVLILMRRLVWPAPARFAGRIAIADPADLRMGGVWRATEVAKLTSSLPVDNMEGMALVPRTDGKVAVWLISDANGAVSQRTLLWKLVVDPARLPGRAAKPAQSSEK